MVKRSLGPVAQQALNMALNLDTDISDSNIYGKSDFRTGKNHHRGPTSMSLNSMKTGLSKSNSKRSRINSGFGIHSTT